MSDVDGSPLRPFLRPARWLPMLIAPAGVLACVALSRYERFFQSLHNRLEAPAPFVIGVVAAIYLFRAAVLRNRLFLIPAFLAAAMTLREIHDLPGLRFMDKGIYIAAGVTAAWALLWRRRLVPALLADNRHAAWLAATFWAYFIALLIQRRVFKAVPGEPVIHRSLEECAETIAHLMFLAAALLASWRRAKPSAETKPSETVSASSGGER